MTNGVQRDRGDIVVYETEDGGVQLDVRLENETIWLTLNQLAELFGRDKSVISRHLRSIYSTGELQREATVAENATVQEEGARSVTRKLDYYNLDAIISVGYRVNSKRGTAFRIWATNVLRQHLVQGYSVHEQRLVALGQSLKLASDITRRKQLSGDEASALLQTVSDYAYALGLLDDYDHQRVAVRRKSVREAVRVDYAEALALIDQMRSAFGDSAVFGVEKDDSLHSSLSAVMQSFGGQDVYPSVEEKAAHLLYFLVKNHSFVDGNKRIAAVVFLRFAEKNDLLYDEQGGKRIADNALVAMTLMIAESKPAEKDVIAAMLTNLIAGDGGDATTEGAEC
ncbi:MAG: virulence protein RhuM/Fic/DOC family protein [Lentisphaerae bacterium]|jgi:prophage maintenance system killer protein|nr:virulence protein RhuM/Fic/DOC family protein [Verrucomicrobiota bacterium]MBT4815587.1 virulence protein RhuM/Fic/DOC family protein [Lentisphaerota bacterium]MBT5609730.1 virulence protein RhuM/Fic/DOC family protein [Lentisphaerota bacterium]MBT7068672.1 virulence protein RhuM/Fic/DOC family protein [Verrucomicrobiota bacterium]MBT7847590.1 virulence protein RhuM/Fic/DOC family protein [Lentisphaerota bacterium]